jgi:ABC-2 type transport system permease protein
MLRVEFVHTLAYRAEFFVWMLTTTLPLIMLGLWSSVASEGPFAHYGQNDFVAYYLATLIIRNLTGSWVVWQINEEIRMGQLNMRLLKPVHPFVGYATTHLAAIPLRTLLAVPISAILLISSAGDLLISDVPRLCVFACSLVGAWLLTFFTLVFVGSLGLFVERSMAILDVYLGIFSLLSGYLVPLDLLPDWVQSLASTLPFKYMLAFQTELLTGRYELSRALTDLAVQWGYAALMITLALALWRRGIRRYEAFGS